MKKLVLVDSEHGYWKTKEDFDDDMDLLRAFLNSNPVPDLKEFLDDLNKDWEFGGGDLVNFERHDGQITLGYDFEDDGHKFTIKESELEKLIIDWLKLVESGAKEITIESQDDEHYTITGK